MVVKFEIEQIPQNLKIEKATLSLYAFRSGGGQAEIIGNNAKSLFQLPFEWTDTTVSWDKPWKKKGGDISSTPLMQNSDKNLKVWENFDVTDYFKTSYKVKTKAIAFLLKSNNHTPPISVQYHCSELKEVQYRPKLSLVVSYEDDTPPSAEVLSPNGGEKLSSNKEYKITWKAKDNFFMNHQILYWSDNNGQSWDSIQTVSADIRSFIWKVPMVSKLLDKCLIKISVFDKKNNRGDDVSDKVFSINPPTGIVNSQNITKTDLFILNISRNKLLKIPTPYRLKEVSVCNLQGTVISKSLQSHNFYSISNNLIPGVYLFSLKSDKHTQHIRILIP